MANVDAPFGLLPIRHKSGQPYNGACSKYYVPASDATALFIGDPVIIAGSADADGVPSVTLATAGSRITGVVVGFVPKAGLSAGSTDSAMDVGYRAASTEAYVLVADEPGLVFEVQEDADLGALTAADVGLNADLIVAAGNTYTKRSGVELDSSTKATTSAQVRIVGFSQRVGNEPGVANATVLVSIVEATETPAAGTTGV